MTWFKLVIVAALFLFFAWIAFLNVVNFGQGIRGKKTGSSIPLIGGISGAIALSITPWPEANRWWWLPLLLDYGCVPLLTFTAVWILSRRVMRKPDRD